MHTHLRLQNLFIATFVLALSVRIVAMEGGGHVGGTRGTCSDCWTHWQNDTFASLHSTYKHKANMCPPDRPIIDRAAHSDNEGWPCDCNNESKCNASCCIAGCFLSRSSRVQIDGRDCPYGCCNSDGFCGIEDDCPRTGIMVRNPGYIIFVWLTVSDSQCSL